MSKRLAAAPAVLAFAIAVSSAVPALAAYCGCDKPPPAPNVAVRPEFSYPGATVVLFSENFVEGRRYTVNFYRTRTLLGLLRREFDASAPSVAVRARDQGDFNPLLPGAPLPRRAQLRVTLPSQLHYGPSRIEVVDPLRPLGPRVLVVAEEDFTVIGRPVVMTENMSNVDVAYPTGISRDGHVFFAFDMHNVRNPILVDARFTELILPLFAQGMTGWNVQGFNVGTLAGVPDDAKFGWRLLDLQGNDVSLLGNASRIRYWRHEFFTWDAAHRPGGAKVLVDDPVEHDYWHQDGTPHFDHDHIIVAVDVSGLDPARLLYALGVNLNLIRLRVSTSVGPNPYAADPNPTAGVQ